MTTRKVIVVKRNDIGKAVPEKAESPIVVSERSLTERRRDEEKLVEEIRKQWRINSYTKEKQDEQLRSLSAQGINETGFMQV